MHDILATDKSTIDRFDRYLFIINVLRVATFVIQVINRPLRVYLSLPREVFPDASRKAEATMSDSMCQNASVAKTVDMPD